MRIFTEPLFLRDKNYIECTVEFKIKGENSVNDIEIQQKPLDFQS